MKKNTDSQVLWYATAEMIAGKMAVSLTVAKQILWHIPEWEKLKWKQIMREARKIYKEMVAV